MNIFSRIFSSFKSTPEEQIIGFSRQELEKLFPPPLPTAYSSAYPVASSLQNIGIHAYYSCLLIDNQDQAEFQRLAESSFHRENERLFNGLPVFECRNPLTADRLIYFISYREFNSVTVRLVTNSPDFLISLDQKKFAVPPPWIAFENYEPSWWGGNMEGAQGFYDNNYFFPFFTKLSEIEKRDYYTRFSATEEWINRLNLMYDNE